MQGYHPQQAVPPGMQQRAGFVPNGMESKPGHGAPYVPQTAYPGARQAWPQPPAGLPGRMPAQTVTAPPQPASVQPPNDRRRISSVMLSEGDAQYRAAKKRKPTDRTLPSFQRPPGSTAPPLSTAMEAKNATLANLSASYTQLQRLENKLDWTISRKRVEMSESIGMAGSASGRQMKLRRKMRLRISNTCAHQLWQVDSSTLGDAAEAKEVDFVSGDGVPGWTLRIEGALLGIDASPEAPPAPRFSNLVNKVVVDVDMSNMAGQDHQHAEWERKPETPLQDGITLEGRGTSNATAHVKIFLNHYPERFAIDAQLGLPLDMNEGSRADIISALWHYVRRNNLTDPEDRKLIRCDDYLKKLFNGAPKAPFSSLADVVGRHIGKVPPMALDYPIVVETDPSGQTKSWDVDIEIDDPIRSETLKLLTAMSQATNDTGGIADQVGKLDDAIAEAAHRTRTVKAKRDTLSAFAADPVNFLKVWLSSQSADIDQLLSGAERSSQTLSGVTSEELRHSEFYRAPWLVDAINLHQGRLFGQRVASAMGAGQHTLQR